MTTALTGAGGVDLRTQLRTIADHADIASRRAASDYLVAPDALPRGKALEAAFRHARTASDELDKVLPQIEHSGLGDDGIRAAKAAVEKLQQGLAAIHDGVHVEDDFLRDGAVAEDTRLTGFASASFHDAAGALRDVADLSAPDAAVNDALRAILGHSA